mgnify:CR=1 FL=1
MSETLVESQQIDSSKRTWLIASSCAGAVGVGAAAIPFVSTFQPSERAKAAGAAVEVGDQRTKAVGGRAQAARATGSGHGVFRLG